MLFLKFNFSLVFASANSRTAEVRSMSAAISFSKKRMDRLTKRFCVFVVADNLKKASINQSFIKYIRLTKTQSNLQASVKNLRLVDILIQLPSNKISIVFRRKGQVVRSHSQVVLVNFWRGQILFKYMPTISHLTDLNKRTSASFTISAAVGASLGRYPDRLNRPMNLSTLPLSPSEANRHQAGAAYIRVAIVVARVTSSMQLSRGQAMGAKGPQSHH